jgi:hypothetical protein
VQDVEMDKEDEKDNEKQLTMEIAESSVVQNPQVSGMDVSMKFSVLQGRLILCLHCIIT